MRKQKQYLVKYQGKSKQVMTGLEISLLQQSGARVKVIKRLDEITK